MFAERCRALAESPRFQRSVLGIIVLNALLMGFETSPGLLERHEGLLRSLNGIVQAIFVAEIGVRLAAHGRRPLGFFRDGWNLFDFAVVALSLLPIGGAFANVARLARILRVARLVTTLPELRLIIGTMLRSIPSLGHVLLLMALLFYVYGVLGVHLFSAVDPMHWGSLGKGVSTLFQILTLEGWVEIQAASREGHPLAGLFYGSYIVIAVFVVINLFIAVVINNLEQTRREEQSALPGDPILRIEAVRRELEALEGVLRGSRR